MKKAISLLLLLATLFGVCSVFASCKNDKDDDSSKVEIPNNQTLVGDAIGAVTLSGEEKSVYIPLSVNDLSNSMEFNIWIDNSSDKDATFVFRAISDDASTSDVEYYYSEYKLKLKPGRNQYLIPFSDLLENKASTILGWGSISELEFSFLSGFNGTVTFENVYVNSQKVGTTYGFKWDAISDAVCFYEDCGLYFYNQLRYAMKDTDEDVAVRSDNDTMYVPVEILAKHRGATDITVSEDKKTVSFKYNSKDYTFTVGNSVEYTGISTGNRPGKALSSKLISSGDYVLVPMEYCADIFGYQLFYNEMGIAIFSDELYQYDSNNTSQYNKLYEMIEDLSYKRYTGAEMLRNMDLLYPNDEHVRIFANQDDFDRLKKLIDTDPTYSAWFTRYSANYDKNSSTYKEAGNSQFYLEDGYRLLQMSREVMNRIVNLALMYKLTDDVDYAKAVAKELTSLTRFRDPMTKTSSWHPEHFLDCGEILWGFSLGYDWCYDAFTDEQRTSYENAVWEMGYGAALGFGDLYDWWQDSSNLAAYEAQQSAELGKEYKYTGYSGKNCYPYPGGEKTVKWENNWSAVCNGGITAMALAFANVKSDDEEKDFRYWSEVLLDCVTYCLPASLKISYAPDGGYPEGPGYWSYGTTYSSILFCCMQSATGSSYGMFNCAGFGESFYFICNMGSKTVGCWNYHDAGSGLADTSLFSMYANVSGDSNIGAYRYDMLMNGTASVSYWDMVFYDPDNYGSSIELTLDCCYKGIQTITFRSSWEDENALFCGLHGGANNASHGQLDIGNFILEYGNVRFFCDLGSDEYNLVAYKGNEVTYFTMPYRHWFYRMRAEGHNTLVVNPTKVNINDTTSSSNQYGRQYDQLFNQTSNILAYDSGETMAYAVVDMGCAYIDAKTGKRGLWLVNNRSTVIVQDEVSFAVASTVYWFAHMAKNASYQIINDGQQAIITVDGVSLLCTIVKKDPSLNTKFSVMAADYLPETGLTTQNGEYSREGYYKLVATTTGVKEYNVAIVCSLLTDGNYDYQWTNISDWFVR